MVVPISPCIGNIHDTKTIFLDPCTGIVEDPGNVLSMDIQPNPAHSKVSITINKPPSIGMLTITGMDGRTIHSTSIASTGNQSMSVQLDVSGYPKGLYIVRLEGENQVTTTRFAVE